MKIRMKLKGTLAMMMVTTMMLAQDNTVMQQITHQLNLSYRYYDVDLKLQNKVSDKFDSLFSQLVERERANATIASPENSLTAKLIAIARYKAGHPERFAEIESTYITGVDNPQFRAPASPQLKAQHVTPDYRLVWEYFLIKPVSSKMSDHFDQRAGDAISHINNNASFITLETVYLNTLKDSVLVTSNALQTKRKFVLNTFAKMPSDQSLHRVLKLVAEDQKSVNKDEQWKPEVYLKSILIGKDNPKFRSQWNSIISRTSSTTLDNRSKRILQTLKQK